MILLQYVANQCPATHCKPAQADNVVGLVEGFVLLKSAVCGVHVCRQDDPEPVKRLKREMEVALSEEDYSAAARIRDHPFMKLAMQIVEERLAGRDSAAEALQVELHNAVKRQQ